MGEAKQAVVVTTQRGVFFGYVADIYPSEKRVSLADARMCIEWTSDMKGVVGFAANGPSASCRISPAAPLIVIEDVTAVMVCTKQAVARWESAPWRK